METLQIDIQIENQIKRRAELNQALIKLLREIDAVNKRGFQSEKQKLAESRKLVL